MRLLWVVARTEIDDKHYIHKRIVRLDTGKVVYRFFPMYRRGQVNFHYMRGDKIVHYETEQAAYKHIRK